MYGKARDLLPGVELCPSKSSESTERWFLAPSCTAEQTNSAFWQKEARKQTIPFEMPDSRSLTRSTGAIAPLGGLLPRNMYQQSCHPFRPRHNITPKCAPDDDPRFQSDVPLAPQGHW